LTQSAKLRAASVTLIKLSFTKSDYQISCRVSKKCGHGEADYAAPQVTSPTTTVTFTRRPPSPRHRAMYNRAYLTDSEPTKTK
jgi:hypothetical protein